MATEQRTQQAGDGGVATAGQDTLTITAPTHWQPARAGQPAPVVATTQAGSTRLH